MKDPRIRQMAEILVDYSTRVKKGDVVFISATGTEPVALVKEVYSLCLARGAKYVEYEFTIPDITLRFLNEASVRQASHFPEHKLRFMEDVDVYIGISGVDNTMALSNANQANFITHQKTMRPIFDRRVAHTRWVVTRFPTNGAAQDARMSLEEYEDYLFSSCCIDWRAESKKMEKLKRLMDRTEQVRIMASDTEISFSLRGMPAVKCDGRFNLPDGEVFSAPVRDSVNGHITYNCATHYQGREFNDIRLVFKDGKIVNATSPHMDDPLNAILDTDEGARFVGEFAVGVNPSIRKPMRNILFDEKIFGSIHLTPGSAYEDCDNGNRSAIHWDMVKLLSGDGEIWFDGVLVQKDGVFVHKDLLGLNPR